MSVIFLEANEHNFSRCSNTCIHGSCEYGSCICEVKYSGGTCKDPNLGYYVGFGCVFFLISAIAFFQLIFCVWAELKRMQRPQFLKACHLTVQKLLYLYVIFAAGSRGVYYTTEVTLPHQWKVDLFAVYYAFVICCFSVLIFFWAEAFHLVEWTADKPQFLKKSSQYFFVFNAFVFSVMIAQLISTKTVTDSETLNLLAEVFSGCFVFLMFMVLIFYLIYGIEIFCKVKGAFTAGSNVFNWTQLSMSRFGLVAQALFQLAATVFFLCDVMQKRWKYRTGVTRRNALEIVSRISELAVALWFPCVLWNCIRPNELWILNPKKLIRSLSAEATTEEETTSLSLSHHRSYHTLDDKSYEDQPQYECWICYDARATDAGPMIFPCNCRGDVAAVHHECLKRWLTEFAHVVQGSNEAPRCKVCNELYSIKEGKKRIPCGMKLRPYLLAFIITAAMVACAVGTYRFCVTDQPPLSKVGFIGIALLAECVLFRWLGFSFVNAYQRIRMATIVVLGRREQVECSDGSAVNSSVPTSSCTQ